jgi:general secretion pathway protein A
MYQDFYGLRELPFELTPNTSYLYLTGVQREALSILEYGLSAAKPITLLVGDAGTGKTTLLWAALKSERCRRVQCVYLNNPVLSPEDFVRMLAGRFELTRGAAESKALLLHELEHLLRERRSRGQITALVVDEAQSLTLALLEEIRLLANIETGTEKLLPLVLAGQPEIATRLDEPRLRQLKQRVTLRCELRPFTLPDTAGYIGSRLITAGGVPATVFTKDAVAYIHKYSHGIARTINVICDNALVTGMALQRRPVDRQVVLEVCRDLSLSPSAVAAREVWPGTPTSPAAVEPPQRILREKPQDLGENRFTFRSLFRRRPVSRVTEAVNE